MKGRQRRQGLADKKMKEAEQVNMPTLKWKKDIAAGEHKRDLERAGQEQKPKL